MLGPLKPNPVDTDGRSATQQPLVNFVVAGAQKSGTRAIANFLSQHPEIGLSQKTRPEPHFFDWGFKGPEPDAASDRHQKYHAMFTHESLAQVTGDITPAYLYCTDALSRIRAYNPAMKIIVILRNPIDRAYSQWVMQTETGRETRAFLPALMHEFRTFHTVGQHRNFSYVQRGFYDGQIARLQNLFPPEQCLILRTEDLLNDHTKTLLRVFTLLGVSTMNFPPPDLVHSRNYPPISPYVRRILKAVFRRDIRRLEVRLDWDCSSWLS